MRLPMKPGQTPDTTAIFPIRFASSMTVASCEEPVFAPRTTSSNRMTFAGEKKCRPMTASGRVVSAAITSMSSRLVVRCQDRARPGDRIEPAKDILFYRHILEHGLDDEIG